ncbi:hypothetical protein AB0F17_49245 [Nonomuraea sp. NPDC026600]|uniref:hypothetical protein n=1 Tax=Nonomuraea sp. NPDC026600 TaxID=3155363 RepID=UPI0033E9F105
MGRSSLSATTATLIMVDIADTVTLARDLAPSSARIGALSRSSRTPSGRSGRLSPNGGAVTRTLRRSAASMRSRSADTSSSGTSSRSVMRRRNRMAPAVQSARTRGSPGSAPSANCFSSDSATSRMASYLRSRSAWMRRADSRQASSAASRRASSTASSARTRRV